MTARTLLLQHLADLTEEDMETLVQVAERLRAKHLALRAPVSGETAPGGAKRHPERFGALAGSVRYEGDVESPVEDASMWTGDLESLTR